MSIDELIREAAARLITVSASARIDARVLAGAAFDRQPADLIRDANDAPSARQRLEYQNLIARRLKGEPVAYIIGEREFWSLTLEVTPEVLIPRPETELLVERALGYIALASTQHVVDLGTGTGAVAIALASERPGIQLTATDASAEALVIARRNAARHQPDRIEFIQTHWWQFAPETGIDMVVSNPPYIASDDPHLERGDVSHEPASALVAADDGLADLREIIQGATRYLKPGGRVLVEHGFDQGYAVRNLFEAAGYEHVTTNRDLNTNERVTEGEWNTPPGD